MAITVPQSRLILNTIMSGLRNELAASPLVEWEVHSDEMNDRNGFIVSEQTDPQYVVTQTDDTVQDLTAGVQDTVFGSQTFKLSRVFGMSFGVGDIESIKDMGSARRARNLNSGIARIATAIDAHIFDVAAKAFPYSTGTWGTALTTPEHFASARTKLAEASIESNAGLSAVLTHADEQKLAKFIYADSPGLVTESSRAMREGFSGVLDGVPLKFSNQLGRITTGTRTNGTVAGAAQNVNYKAVADSGTNAGFYMTQTINLAGLGAAGTIKAGEVFSIAGVTAFDPEIQAVRPFAAQFTVITDAVADGAGAATVRIFPAIIVPTPGAITGDTGVNSAHATVDVAPANGAIVTFEGAASTSFVPRVMWKRGAIVAHSAQLTLPYTGTGFRRSLADAQRDNIAPVMPRVWFSSDPNTGAHRVRVDVFVQAQVRNRWQGIKFFGA